MLVLSRKPGEAIVVGRPAPAEEPRVSAPPPGPTGRGSAGGGVGPAPCPASAPAAGRRPGGAPPSRPGARLDRAGRRRHWPVADGTAQGRSAAGDGFRAV